MTTEHVSANAEGLPAINRRRLLLGLAAASTAAATVTVVEAATPAENPELIRLGAELPALVAEHQASKAAEAAILKEWASKWPNAPEIIYRCGGPDVERDIVGRGIPRLNRFGEMQTRSIWTAEEARPYLERTAERLRSARSKCVKADRQEELASWQAILNAIQEYEDACEHIRKASGYPAAQARAIDARDALLSHVDATLREPAETMAGVVIQAQAVHAIRDVPALYRISREALQDRYMDALSWGDMLALSLLRIAEGGAA